MNKNIILKDIKVEDYRIEYKFSYSNEIGNYFLFDTMFCEYDCDLKKIPQSILTIPFIGSILALCWLENITLWIPSLDKTYYEAIKNVKIAYEEMYPDCPLKGRIIPARLENNEISDSQKGLILFGGGVDAHTTFIRNMKNIFSLVNIQGWYYNADDNNSAAESDFKHCKEVALENQKNYHLIKSNFAVFLNTSLINKKFSKFLHDQWWHGFQHSMAFISIAVPIAFLNGLSVIYIGSSYTIGDNKSCASFITTDSEFRYSKNGQIIHDSFELNRQQKTQIIVKYQQDISKPYPLKVCSFNNLNCCECEKCFRTISALIAENANPRDFGFQIKTSLKEHFVKVMDKHLALWGIEKELKYWISTSMDRMRENYEIIEDREFVDWILSYNFYKEKKKLLKKYYRNNFFSIVKRKIKNYIFSKD